ncbi:uncharacterized protein ISCGN_016246 [Ixodes scapularis]
MARSDSEVVTADAGRGDRPFCILADYRIVLPTLPAGDKGKKQSLPSLRCKRQALRIVDFKEPLEKANLRKDVAGLGVCQMGHVWLCSLKIAVAKERLLQLGRLTVKEKLGVPVDLNRQEVRAKLHWVPFVVSNDTLRKALEEYGTVHEVTKKKWAQPDKATVEGHDNKRAEATVQDEKRTETAPGANEKKGQATTTGKPSPEAVVVMAMGSTEAAAIECEPAMELDPSKVKRRLDDESPKNVAQVQQSSEGEFQLIGKKGRYVSKLRSSSLTRDGVCRSEYRLSYGMTQRVIAGSWV